MLWLKALHLIFMVTWFAGLFYLPRLFVYHAMTDDPISLDRFKVMERKLYYGIMTPGMVLTLLFGIWLLFLGDYLGQLWLQIKLALILILVFYHLYCGKLVSDFKHERNSRSHIFYRWFNEFPVLILIAVVILAVIRPQ
ncbi:MAG: protoporphyrinogen oxidase HemJ [Thioalkalispiraceae bacterium]|jgi:putative membrane protein